MKTLIQTNETLNNGIFKKLQPLLKLDFITPEIAELLDYDFYINRKTKIISNLFEHFLEVFSLEEALEKMTKIIIIKYRDNWEKIYKTYNAVYDPLENYADTTEENVESNITSSNTSQNKYQGFNSIQGKDTNSTTNSNTISGDFDKNRRLIKKSGFNGNKQEMIKNEIYLRDYVVFKRILRDVDNELCLGTWD